jgi:hypothetical protein
MPLIREYRALVITTLLLLGGTPETILQDEKGEGDMSDDSRGSRGADAKPTSSEEWGAPPAWSPWNFQFPNLNRDEHIYRARTPTRMQKVQANSGGSRREADQAGGRP